MSEFLISLICHAERSGEPEDRKHEWTEWVPDLLALLDRIEKDTGCHIPTTWCCCANHSREYVDSGRILVAQQFPEIWKRIKDRGDEIGLHIHYDPEVGDRRFKFCSHEFQQSVRLRPECEMRKAANVVETLVKEAVLLD